MVHYVILGSSIFERLSNSRSYVMSSVKLKKILILTAMGWSLPYIPIIVIWRTGNIFNYYHFHAQRSNFHPPNVHNFQATLSLASVGSASRQKVCGVR